MPLGIHHLRRLPRFDRAYKKLPPDVRAMVDEVLAELYLAQLPAGRRLELLRGPAGIWSVRVDRRYRVTFAVEKNPTEGAAAVLRNVGMHDDVYSAP